MTDRKFDIVQARALSKLSQSEMASRLGISERTYKYKEKNPRKFTMAEMLNFCDICNLELKDLIFLPPSDTKVTIKG